MNNQDIFIGREKELKMIDEMIFDPTGTNHILRIIGKGGVGKTWLLRELYRRYQQEPSVILIRIDYAEVRTQSLPSLARYLLQQFSHHAPEKQTEKFYRQLSDWERLSSLKISPLIIREQEDKVYIYWIDIIKKISLDKRIVLLSDTGEAISLPEDQVHRINRLMSNLPNTVAVVAARLTDNVKKSFVMYPTIYKSWRVHEIYELNPFSHHETIQYFSAVLPVEMPVDLRDKIFLLTAGNPILIALAGEWVTRHIDLPKDVDLPLAELQALDEATLAQRRQRFEFALVDKQRSLGKPVRWATLYLAYLNRRYDRKILELALGPDLGLDDEQLNQVVAELKTLVFVRKSMSAEGGLLHDEAQRLIRKHVWRWVDPTRELQQELATRVIEGYYLPEIERLSQIVQAKLAQSIEHKLIAPEHRRLPPIPDEDWLKRELQIECLDYHFRIGEEKGWDYLNELFDEALNYHYSLIQMDAIMQAVHNLAPKQVDSARFKVRVAQTLLVKGEVSKAISMARTVLNQANVNPSDAAEALMVLGRATTTPTLKIREFQAALEKARLAQDYVLEAQALKLLGLAYRQQGKWPEAVKTSQQSLRLLNEEEEREQYADTLNNLAFVTMLNGNPTRADTMAEKALRIRKAQGNLHGLSLSYATKGRIAEALGYYDQAIRYHRTAVDLAQSVADFDNVALFQTNLAVHERFNQNFATVRELLSAGLKSQRPDIRARAYLEAAKMDRDEVDLLRFRGASNEEILAKYDSAEEKAQRALELADEVGDEHQVASILLELALITYYREQREDKEHIQKLREILKQRNYTLEKGYLTELMGHLAYTKGNLLTAFEKYLEACELFSGYSPASFEQTFQRVRDKYLDASSQMQEQICALIEEKFPTVHPASPLARLKELCVFADF